MIGVSAGTASGQPPVVLGESRRHPYRPKEKLMMEEHIHSLDRCAFELNGDEVLWCCGYLPMFTNVATARASDGSVPRSELVTIERLDHGTFLGIFLRSREGGRLLIGQRVLRRDAEYVRDSVVAFLGSWFGDQLDQVSEGWIPRAERDRCECGHVRASHPFSVGGFAVCYGPCDYREPCGCRGFKIAVERDPEPSDLDAKLSR